MLFKGVFLFFSGYRDSLGRLATSRRFWYFRGRWRDGCWNFVFLFLSDWDLYSIFLCYSFVIYLFIIYLFIYLLVTKQASYLILRIWSLSTLWGKQDDMHFSCGLKLIDAVSSLYALVTLFAVLVLGYGLIKIICMFIIMDFVVFTVFLRSSLSWRLLDDPLFLFV